MISAIAFRDGRAHSATALSTAAYLENKGWQNLVSRRLWHPKARWPCNAFDLETQKYCQYKYHLLGRTFSAVGAADPHRLDPHTLETLGKDSLNGVLSDGETFAAHPRFD